MIFFFLFEIVILLYISSRALKHYGSRVSLKERFTEVSPKLLSSDVILRFIRVLETFV